MKKSKVGLLIAFLLIAGAVWAQTLTNDQIQQMLLAQAPQAALELTEVFQQQGTPESVQVAFVRADLDGTGNFSYIVAYYSTETSNGGYLRVFKQSGANLVLAGDEEKNQQVGGFSTTLTLIDVNGDGIPEVLVTSMSHDGQQESFSLHSWTGTALHDMLPRAAHIGSLVDIDADGVMELVRPNRAGVGFDIYKLVGTTYQFLSTVPQDPRGIVSSTGKMSLVRAFCKSLQPASFLLSDIRAAQAGTLSGGANVKFLFGALQRTDGSAVGLDQVDPSTIVIGPNLAPAKASIESEPEDACPNGGVEAEITRSVFLKNMQKLQFDAPLAAGNQLDVKLRAKLKDGTAVSAVFKATVTASQ